MAVKWGVLGTAGIARGCTIPGMKEAENCELCYTITSEEKETLRKISVRQNYALETEQLGRCIENGEEPFVSPDFSIRNAKLLDAVLERIGY